MTVYEVRTNKEKRKGGPIRTWNEEMKLKRKNGMRPAKSNQGKKSQTPLQPYTKNDNKS